MDNNEMTIQFMKTMKIQKWKVASKMGVSEMTLTRWLRYPLTPEREEKIWNAYRAILEDIGREMEVNG